MGEQLPASHPIWNLLSMEIEGFDSRAEGGRWARAGPVALLYREKEFVVRRVEQYGGIVR